MKHKITIEIQAEFASPFQDMTGLKTLELMINAWKTHKLSTHKKNKVTYEIKYDQNNDCR